MTYPHITHQRTCNTLRDFEASEMAWRMLLEQIVDRGTGFPHVLALNEQQE